MKSNTLQKKKTNALLLHIALRDVLAYCCLLFAIITAFSTGETRGLSSVICLILFLTVWIVTPIIKAPMSLFQIGEFCFVVGAMPVIHRTGFSSELHRLILYDVLMSIGLFFLIQKSIKEEKKKRFWRIRKALVYFILLLFSFTWLIQLNESLDGPPKQLITCTVISKRKRSNRYSSFIHYEMTVQYTDDEKQHQIIHVEVEKELYKQIEENDPACLCFYSGAFQSPYCKLILHETE